MDSRPNRFLYLEGYMALKSTFFSLWHHRRLICFIKQSRKRENSNLWKGFANQKRIWKCWQMVVSPDVSRRCWLESVSSVSLQNIFPAKIQLFQFPMYFQVGPSYNLHWFYCTFSTVHCCIKHLQILWVKTLLQMYTAFTFRKGL